MTYRVVILCLIYVCSASCIAYQILYDSSNEPDGAVRSLVREKRQLEDLDTDEFPSAPLEEAQEEPGFWDKVVKVALRLFNKFIEWLNSS